MKHNLLEIQNILLEKGQKKAAQINFFKSTPQAPSFNYEGAINYAWAHCCLFCWVGKGGPRLSLTPQPASCPPGWAFPHLHRVEPAVAIEREANDVRGVLVPAGIDRVAHDVARLWKDLLDEGLLAAECDALPQVWRDPHHQAVTGPASAPLLLLLLPALKFTYHGL